VRGKNGVASGYFELVSLLVQVIARTSHIKKINPSLETFPYGKFRAGYRHIIDEHAGEPFALGPHGRPEVVVMPSELFQQMAGASRQLEEMSRTMPILLAAARAGVAFPSETLAALGYRPEFDANKLANFVSRFAGGATHDEEGQPLPESRVALGHEPVEEDDLELTYSDSLVSA